MSVEDILAALYNDPQSGMAPDQVNPLNAAPGGLYDASSPAPSSLATSSGLSNDTTVAPSIAQVFGAGTTIQALLSQIYGTNPFGALSYQYSSGTKNKNFYKNIPPLAGIPPQFAQAVVEEMLKQQQDITDAAELTRKIQQYWQNPDTQRLYGLMQAQGASPTTIGNSLATLVKYGDQPAVMPFDPRFMTVSGYGFLAADSDYASGQHEGVDYGVPANTPLIAPFAGRATVNSGGPLGNSVTITFGNGWRMVFGHMNMAVVQNGQLVNPGTFLGYSGSTGNSSGPHLHLAVYDPHGHPVDPSGILTQIHSGKSIGQLMVSYGPGLSGPGLSHTETLLRGLGIYDPELHAVYSRANDLYRTYFGREPDDQTLLDIIGHGSDEAQMEGYIRSLPSHIAGIAMGHYTDLRKLADAESQKIYGNPAPDSIIKGLYDSQATTPNAVQFYYSQLPFQPSKDVSPIIYDQVYKSASAYSQAVWNSAPHPTDLQAVANAAGVTATATPPPSDTKAALNG